MAAAAALGAVQLDRTDARLALDQDGEARTTAATLLSRCGLARGVA